MVSQITQTDKNLLLRQLLPLISSYGLVRKWSTSNSPYDDLEAECIAIGADQTLFTQFQQYLVNNEIIPLTVDTFLFHYSVAGFARADQIPYPARILARRGVWIGRWLPTFLVIDGPLGRFLCHSDSPLCQLLKNNYDQYPILAQARDLFNHNLFRQVRNGFAHWAFTFEGQSGTDRLICYDWDSGKRTVDISVLEAEGLHIASFAIIECLDHAILKPAIKVRHVQ